MRSSHEERETTLEPEAEMLVSHPYLLRLPPEVWNFSFEDETSLKGEDVEYRRLSNY